jgi:hypothetical protein
MPYPARLLLPPDPSRGRADVVVLPSGGGSESDCRRPAALAFCSLRANSGIPAPIPRKTGVVTISTGIFTGATTHRDSAVAAG